MAEDAVTIEVDGKPLQARKGQMLIEVTDHNDVYVPRFCYHSKLSVAANCRMCLVEVEKAPKPLPACATPVNDGMVVRTRSRLALEAQKSVMEFLLINHPLDCPICDQGGECELQDLAMGFGGDVSRYQEKKRVVKDKNIGPLIQTEMTRCIHCTRCVRFGEEIAGLRELGATGRGEDMEIGTYIEKSVSSELAGNVIDLCPVGALTDKPFRYSARTWEMTQHAGISPHDSLGSNLHFHVKQDRIKRVVPAENESVNEVWLSDRDRYSYQGLYSDDRLLYPRVRIDGRWEEVEWEIAFRHVNDALRQKLKQHGPQEIGALASGNATCEELFLLQKLMRGLGSGNIDHRLTRTDFSDQDNDPLYPGLGQPVAGLEDTGAALVIGGNPRRDQPLLNLRLRKAALKGADIMYLNPVDFDINYRISEKRISRSAELVTNLAAVLKALQELAGADDNTGRLLQSVKPAQVHRDMAAKLRDGEQATVLIGSLAVAHPEYSSLRYLAGQLARLAEARLGFLGEGANGPGGSLAGAVPHRGPGGQRPPVSGLTVSSMLAREMETYVLLNVEPELDCNQGGLALEAMRRAGLVVAITPYASEAMLEYADVLLPMALYAENEGSYINIQGQWQSFAAVVPPPGEARPAWKILRKLADTLDVGDFNYASLASVFEDLSACNTGMGIQPDNSGDWTAPDRIGTKRGKGLERISEMPLYSGDPLVRRAKALQQSGQVADGTVHIGLALARELELANGDQVSVIQDEREIVLPVTIDERLPAKSVLLQAAHPRTAGLGQWFGDAELRKV